MHAGVGRLTASLLLTLASAHGATAMAADAAPALNYSLGGSFASGLFAAGIGQQDECDEPAPLAEGLASALADNRDMLLASLDTDKAVRKPAPPAAPVWEIMVSDKTLNAALQRWAAAAGWQLLWELPVDYAVEARTTVPGNFDEAVNTVVKSMESAEIPMKAVFYQGNKVLRIMVKGSE
jgi:hypothetical protein